MHTGDMFKTRHHIPALFSIIFLAIVLSGCANSLFYYPDKKIYSNPSHKNLAYEDVFFYSKDGTKLHGWFLPSKTEPAESEPVGTVIHFHGNARNLTAHVSFVDWLPASNFNLFTFDYRGYGRSEGTPTRQGIYEDCIAAIRYIQTRKDIDQSRLFILGQSLGGVNALAVLGENTFSGIRAIAVDSAFYSYRRIVKDKIGAIPIIGLLKSPLSFLVVSNQYSPCNVMGQISPIPLFIIHGTSDQVVPYQHGKALFDAAKPPKYLYTVDGGKHTEAFTARFGTTYRTHLIAFYKDCIKKIH